MGEIAPDEQQKNILQTQEALREMGLRSFAVESLPFAMMVIVECLDCGLTTISKAAMNKGMSQYVFVFYSNALAAFMLLPVSFVFERTKRPTLSFSLLCKFFLLSLAGITIMQICVFTGINYGSPTLGSAMSNLIPAFTFILAVIFRMEKLNLRSLRSLIKIVGTLVSITGALTVTLYKGHPIGSSKLEFESLSSSNIAFQSSKFLPHLQKMSNNWAIGGLFLAIACLSAAIWNTAQASILQGYPSKITIVAFYCLFGSIQCGVVSLVAERNHPNAWKIKPDIELISIIYSAVCGSIITFGVQTWCIHRKGPVFVAMFKPLSIAIAAFMSVIFLGDTLDVGIIIGAVVIITGFYGVMWAQSKDNEEQGDSKVDSLQKTPLLQNQDV